MNRRGNSPLQLTAVPPGGTIKRLDRDRSALLPPSYRRSAIRHTYAAPLARKREIVIMASGRHMVWLAFYIAVTTSCDVRSVVESDFVLPEDFNCAEALPGWQRARVVTPDVVLPCMTGSSGSCEGSGYTYVSGTGWCRPR
jgi:hypothetical protein